MWLRWNRLGRHLLFAWLRVMPLGRRRHGARVSWRTSIGDHCDSVHHASVRQVVGDRVVLGAPVVPDDDHPVCHLILTWKSGRLIRSNR